MITVFISLFAFFKSELLIYPVLVCCSESITDPLTYHEFGIKATSNLITILFVWGNTNDVLEMGLTYNKRGRWFK